MTWRNVEDDKNKHAWGGNEEDNNEQDEKTTIRERNENQADNYGIEDNS